MSMVLPGVVGFKLSGKLRDGVTATDLVLTVTQMLRKHGVVGKFVEFYGKVIDIVNHVILTVLVVVTACFAFLFFLPFDINLYFHIQVKACVNCH